MVIDMDIDMKHGHGNGHRYGQGHRDGTDMERNPDMERDTNRALIMDMGISVLPKTPFQQIGFQISDMSKSFI
jgi:hypothetical protein